MDIAVKQRILGGVVLVAAAILFLPVVLEGAGVKALQPPSPPTPPTTPSLQDLAPALQQHAQGLAKDIAASHGEPTFYPVEPVVSEEPAPTPAMPEQFRLVEPAAPVVAPVVKAPPAKVVIEKKALAEKAVAEKPVAEKKIVEKITPVAKAQAIPKPSAPALADPDPALPQAWVVQVARLNAQEKANALVDKLRARGYRATATGSGDSWRVIIGPELDRTVADSVKRRLAEDPQLKLNGWIQAYRP